MNRAIHKEQKVAQSHPVGMPLIFIVIGSILLFLFLAFLVIRSSNRQTPPQDLNHPVQQFENQQEDDYGL